MNLTLLSNILNLTGNVICESSRIVDSMNVDKFNINNDNMNYKIPNCSSKHNKNNNNNNRNSIPSNNENKIIPFQRYINNNNNNNNTKRRNIDCKFHKLGKCYRGKMCKYNHNF